MHKSHAKAMQYAICNMYTFTWERHWDPEKSMHYEIYALLGYAL